MSNSLDLLPCPWCAGPARLVEDRGDNRCEPLLHRPQCSRCGGGLGGFDTKAKAVAAWNTRAPVADTAEPYEATDAEVREGEQLDSVSYVIRRGETDETAFRRAARAEIVRLRRYLAQAKHITSEAEGER